MRLEYSLEALAEIVSESSPGRILDCDVDPQRIINVVVGLNHLQGEYWIATTSIRASDSRAALV